MGQQAASSGMKIHARMTGLFRGDTLIHVYIKAKLCAAKDSQTNMRGILLHIPWIFMQKD